MMKWHQSRRGGMSTCTRHGKCISAPCKSVGCRLRTYTWRRIYMRHSSVLGLFCLVLENILLGTRCTHTIVCVMYSCTKRRSESSRLTHKHKACFVRVSILCKRHTPKCMLGAAVCASSWSIVRVISTFPQMLTGSYSDVEYIRVNRMTGRMQCRVFDVSFRRTSPLVRG